MPFVPGRSVRDNGKSAYPANEMDTHPRVSRPGLLAETFCGSGPKS